MKASADYWLGRIDGLVDEREALPEASNHSDDYRLGWTDGAKVRRDLGPRVSARLMRLYEKHAQGGAG